MGMQIPCGVHPQVSAQGALRFVASALGQPVPRVGAPQGMRDRGGAPDGRSCAHAGLDSAEILGLAGDGVYERQERDPHCADLWREAKELRGPDRKSTRLNSSHLVISYAVFCLKKKKKNFTVYSPTPIFSQ